MPVVTPLGPAPGFAPLLSNSKALIPIAPMLPDIPTHSHPSCHPRQSHYSKHYSAAASTTPVSFTPKGVHEDTVALSSRPNKLNTPTFINKILQSETLSPTELSSWHNYLNREDPSIQSQTAYVNAAEASHNTTPRVLNLDNKGKPLKLHTALREEFTEI